MLTKYIADDNSDSRRHSECLWEQLSDTHSEQLAESKRDLVSAEKRVSLHGAKQAYPRFQKQSIFHLDSLPLAQPAGSTPLEVIRYQLVFECSHPILAPSYLDQLKPVVIHPDSMPY